MLAGAGELSSEREYDAVTVLLIALALEWATGTLILSAFRRR